jgi:preprotein translocase subunit SecF
MDFFTHHTSLKFVTGYSKTISQLFACASLIMAICGICVYGINLSLEFTGGVQVELKCKHDSINHLKTIFKQLELGEIRWQQHGSSEEILLKIPVKDFKKVELQHAIQQALKANNIATEIKRIEYIGAEVGKQLTRDGLWAFILSLLAIFLYITLRFEKKLAFSAIGSLLHDVTIILGILSICKVEFDLSGLASLLAVIGYSLNDKIVVFDRVRELCRKTEKHTLIPEIFNTAINQTLSRTIMTSGLTLAVVLALLIWGGHSLFGFALIFTIGIFVGTYSSIYVASNIAIMMGFTRKHLSLDQETYAP